MQPRGGRRHQRHARTPRTARRLRFRPTMISRPRLGRSRPRPCTGAIRDTRRGGDFLALSEGESFEAGQSGEPADVPQLVAHPDRLFLEAGLGENGPIENLTCTVPARNVRPFGVARRSRQVLTQPTAACQAGRRHARPLVANRPVPITGAGSG